MVDSEKFPVGHERLKDALASDDLLISAAFAVRDRISGNEAVCKSAYRTDQNGLSSDQNGLSSDQIGLSNIREEVVSEVEKNLTTQDSANLLQ